MCLSESPLASSKYGCWARGLFQELNYSPAASNILQHAMTFSARFAQP